jgi:hypothetical protein
MQKVATAMVEAGIRGADRGTVKLEDIADFLSSSGYDGLAEQIYTEIEARMGGKTTKTFSLKDARRAVDSYLGGLKGPKKKAWEGLLPAERERRREAYAAEIVTSVRRGPERMMKNLGRLDILVGRSIQNVDALHPSGVERERGMGIDIERRERDAERPRGKRFRGRL